VEYWRHNTWGELDTRGVKAQDGLSAQHTGCDARVRATHHVYARTNDENLLEKVRPYLYEMDAHGGRRLPMLNCWPVASAMLQFDDSRYFARAIRQLEVPSSQAYSSSRITTILQEPLSTLGFSIYERVESMSRRTNPRMVSLFAVTS
jgi:hypothetical protein